MAHRRYKKLYDRKAKVRKFQKGDLVLILLPTEMNKLHMQWKVLVRLRRFDRK